MTRFLFGKQIWFLVAVAGVLAKTASAGDLRIPLPGRGQLTPVQRLNRDGVDAVRKQQLKKATAIFYKAYLYDPEDPFTLNNLGYMAELEGDADRAQKFYDLAARQTTGAVIDRASSRDREGRSFADEIAGVKNPSVRVERANVAAVWLLSKGRSTEAEALLANALQADPQNAFTLNNLGVAKEAEGELESALQYYKQAANAHSSRPIVVTFNRVWRDRPVSEVAAASARQIQARLQNETPQERAARWNFRGVEAINRNEWRTAAQDFRVAYSLDPNSAFSLNNLGYASEASGDPETAQFFYQKARQAPGSGAAIDLATVRSAEGESMVEVSSSNDQKMAARMAAEAEARRRQPGRVELKHRDNTPVVEPAPPASETAPQSSPAPASSNSIPGGSQPVSR
jgi:Flp pilus assembly protein TadD